MLANDVGQLSTSTYDEVSVFISGSLPLAPLLAPLWRLVLRFIGRLRLSTSFYSEACGFSISWGFRWVSIDSSPIVVGKRILVGSSDGNLYELDARSGKELWRFEAGGPISASPAVGERALVIGTQDGVLYCFGERIRAETP